MLLVWGTVTVNLMGMHYVLLSDAAVKKTRISVVLMLTVFVPHIVPAPCWVWTTVILLSVGRHVIPTSVVARNNQILATMGKFGMSVAGPSHVQQLVMVLTSSVLLSVLNAVNVLVINLFGMKESVLQKMDVQQNQKLVEVVKSSLSVLLLALPHAV